MQKTALFDIHQEAGARLIPFAGYMMPVEYTGVKDEHLTVREKAGLFDISHMGIIMVRGTAAEAFLQKVTTNDVSKLYPGKIHYTLFPNGKGGIVDDLLVYQMADNEFMLVVNAANIKKDENWLRQHLTGNVEIENTSDSTSILALQGPLSGQIMQEVTATDISSFKGFTCRELSVADFDNILVSTTGYTGAGGFEIYCTNKQAPHIWEALFKVGRNYGLKPIGLAARDTLRLEMGYTLYGNDIDDTTSPYEAGLGWVVKLDKNSDFIDKEYLVQQKKQGVTRKLKGIEMIDRGIPRKGYKLLDQAGLEIGQVCSGTMSPSLGKGIGMAYIATGQAKEDNLVWVAVRNKKLKAKVVKMPFR